MLAFFIGYMFNKLANFTNNLNGNNKQEEIENFHKYVGRN